MSDVTSNTVLMQSVEILDLHDDVVNFTISCTDGSVTKHSMKKAVALDAARTLERALGGGDDNKNTAFYRDYDLSGDWALYRGNTTSFVSKFYFYQDGTISGNSKNEMRWSYKGGKLIVFGEAGLPTTIFDIKDFDEDGQPRYMEGMFIPSLEAPAQDQIKHILMKCYRAKGAHFGRLSNVAASAEECAYFEQNKIDYSYIISERKVVSIPKPRVLINLSGRYNFYEKFTNQYLAEEVRCDVVHDAIVLGGTTVLSADAVPLYSTTYHSRRPLYNALWDDALGALNYQIERSTVSQGDYYFLSGLEDKNIGHWMIQEMPNILVFEKLRDMGVGRPGKAHFSHNKFTKYSYDHIKAIEPDYKFEQPGALHSTKRYERLYVPSLHRLSEAFEFPEIIGEALLRLREAAPSPAPEGKRLFLTRKNVRRGFANEDSVIEALQAIGFEPLDPGTLTEAEKRDVFGRAEVIMGVHGGGMQNFVYANRNCQIIEIFNEKYNVWWTYRAAGLMGLSYSSICLPIDEKDRARSVDEICQFVDIGVFVDCVKSMLEKLGLAV